MSSRPGVFVADLLQALCDLDVRTPATALAVMRMLNLDDWQAIAAAAPAAAIALQHVEADADQAPPPAVDAPLASAADPEARPLDAPTGETLRVQPLPPDAAVAPPAWLGSAPLPRAGRASSPPVPPLFDRRRARALLGALVASRDREGPPDLSVCIDLLARGKALAALPRQPSWRIGGGLQLLVDDGPGMAPFRADVSGLIAQLADLLPADRLQLLRFEGTPLRGCRDGRRRGRWPWRPPAPGRAVLLVTELGLADAGPFAARGNPHEWFGFAAAARAAGVQLRSLVPYPADRWPAALAPVLHPVHWDRWTTVAQVRQRAVDAARTAGH